MSRSHELAVAQVVLDNTNRCVRFICQRLGARTEEKPVEGLLGKKLVGVLGNTRFEFDLFDCGDFEQADEYLWLQLAYVPSGPNVTKQCRNVMHATNTVRKFEEDEEYREKLVKKEE